MNTWKAFPADLKTNSGMKNKQVNHAHERSFLRYIRIVKHKISDKKTVQLLWVEKLNFNNKGNLPL